ncbi:D-cysteine desulfhydrase [Oceanotoga teriensis]|uniref:D-cysteine desulfhydrase n=1 Tax=Oceanotoga teriensis TaxID=515440 RepID=A0AA45HJJ2_9BACT|nr:D-cysteine desulfhydrase family protein [Oceanotoga teriensis]PWJ96164.1 D-cysteine desulfhydrase [Oceanotoga teriensis]
MKILNDKFNFANLPTKIELLSRFSELVGKNIYFKRDDQTGTEFSGNKVRKLEYLIKFAIDKGYDSLITCGGIQSNHARATAAIAARIGLKCHLVLRGDENSSLDGNLLLDNLFDADIKFINSEEYSHSRNEIMENITLKLKNKGEKCFIIPEGASEKIGNLGYINCLFEIVEQEKNMNIQFDNIITAVGSGGTYSGLYLGHKIKGIKNRVIGINVCNNREYFLNKIYDISNQTKEYFDLDLTLKREDINIIDGYVGKGYALSSEYEIDFIKKISKLEGIVLDPVYTVKAMYGLYKEIKKGTFKNSKNILFINTGGLFGIFPQKDLF